MTEHIGSIIEDEVKKQCYLKVRYLETTLKMHLTNMLASTEEDTELFEALLCSYANRLGAINNANSRHTDYSLKIEQINYFVILVFLCLRWVKSRNSGV